MARENDTSAGRSDKSMPFAGEGRSLREQLSERLRDRPEYEEYLRLLADKDLWALMLVPFSSELAEFTEQVTRPTAPATPRPAVPVPEAVEMKLPPSADMVIIREAIARSLRKPASEVTEADYADITELDLSQSSIADLQRLANLRNIRTLNLSGCKKVANFAPLNGLTSLQWLYLANTQVSDKGVSMLQQALPGLQILR